MYSTPVARMRMLFSPTVIQSMVVPGDPMTGDARHLYNRQYRRARVVGLDGKDIHQTDVTLSEYEATLDTMSNAIVDASHFICSAGRPWAEGLELGTVRE